MSSNQIIAVAVAGLGALVWLANLGLLALSRRGVPLLSRLRPPEPEVWPPVSVIIPACNEAHTLEAALGWGSRILTVGRVHRSPGSHGSHFFVPPGRSSSPEPDVT